MLLPVVRSLVCVLHETARKGTCMMGEVIHDALHLQDALLEWLFSAIRSLAYLNLKSTSLSRCLVHGCRSFAFLSSIDSVANHFTEAALASVPFQRTIHFLFTTHLFYGSYLSSTYLLRLQTKTRR